MINNNQESIETLKKCILILKILLNNYNLKYNFCFNSTKMTQCGYDKQRFPNLNTNSFDCILCSSVVRQPKECNGCGYLYCQSCIENWLKKKNTCPNCMSNVIDVVGKVLLKMYNELDIKCQFYDRCKSILKMIDLQKHQQLCGKPKCWNVANCQGNQNPSINQNFVCCSQICVLLKKIIDADGNQKKIYQELKKPFSNSLVHSNLNSSNYIIPNTIKTNVNGFKWDSKKVGLNVQITQQNQQVFLKQQAYIFRTIITDIGFTNGVHYWQIIADPRTQNQLKIGVSLSKEFDFNSAFSDHAFGYAYYGLGQLRHNSNASGAQYGKKFKKQGILGVRLDMNKGTLSFALNGEYMGVAFNTQNLKKGPIYPAVSLLHCAGCKIRGGNLPNYFRD